MDDEIDGGAPVAGAVVGGDGGDAGPGAPAGRRPPRTTRSAAFLVFIVAAAAGRLYEGMLVDDSFPAIGAALPRVVLVGYGRWRLASAMDVLGLHDDLLGQLLDFARGRSRGSATGYVLYELEGLASLGDGSPIGPAERFWDLYQRLRGERAQLRAGGESRGEGTLGAFIANWSAEARLGSSLFDGLIFEASVALASHLFAGNTKYFHVVALGNRFRTRDEMLAKSPSQKVVQRFLQGAARDEGDREGEPAVVPRATPWKKGAIPAWDIINWIECTKDLKQIRSRAGAMASWAQLFARHQEFEAEHLTRPVRQAPYDTLRRARYVLDVVCMLIWREWFLASDPDLYFHLFTDASPQWRGQELFATTIDVLAADGSRVQRCLMPVVNIGKTMADAGGKTFAILWKIMLLVGPYYTRLRSFCNRVRSTTTDLGVERLVHRSADILPEFCRALKIALPRGFERQPRLFPRAVLAPGWNHIIDNLLQRALTSLFWFPRFIGQLKAFCKFMRHYSDDISTDLRSRGLDGAAELLTSVTVPGFANWRWTTLRKVCDATDKIFATFVLHFPTLGFVARMRDTTLARTISAVVRSTTWSCEFWFTRWIATELSRLQQWGSGCVCHAEELRLGLSIDCHRKGRVLQQAFPKAWAGRGRDGRDGRDEDGTGRDGTGRHGTDGTGRDGTGRDGTGRDRTGRDGTGRDRTGPFKTL